MQVGHRTPGPRRSVGRALQGVILRDPWGWAAGAVAVAAFAFYLYLARDHYFAYDEWQYWTFRRDLLDSGAWKDFARFLLAPHNGHLQALIWIVWLPLDWLFGMHSYVPYLLAALVLHSATGMLLFHLLRERVRPVIALGAAALYLFYAQATAATSHAFTLGITTPIAAIYIALIAIQRLERRRERAMVGISLGAVLVSLLVASGVGLVVVAVVGFAYALRGRLGLAVGHVTAGGATYLLWQSRFDTAPVSFAIDRMGDYGRYVWDGLTASGADLVQTGGSGIGVLVLALTVGAVAWSLAARDGSAFAYAATLFGGLLFYAVVAVRGVDLDPAVYSADQGRYLLIGAALMLPSLAWIADRLLTLRAWVAIPLVLALVWSVPATVLQQLEARESASELSIANRRTIETAASIVDLLGPAENGVLVADRSARFSAAQLQRLDRLGKLPCRVDYEAAVALAAEAGIPQPTSDQVTCD